MRVTVGQASSVQGTIYTDVNGDGQYNAGDTPLQNVGVKITASDSTVYTVTTDASGHFSQGVPAGNTIVDVDDATLPPGSVLTTNARGEGSDPTVVNVPAGGIATDNTGYVTPAQTGTVQGTIYIDTNRNGLYDAGDTLLPGVQVKIAASNGGIYTVTTDANGFFSRVVPAGNTMVDVNDATLPAGSVLTTNAFGQGSDPTVINVPANGVATGNTGYVTSPGGTGTVNGTVYKDNNRDGVYNTGDTPLPGVTVMITSSTGGIYTVTTDANGFFSRVVPAGNTMVAVNDATLPPNLVLASGGGNSDPTTVAVPANGTATDNTGYVDAAPALSLDKTATPKTYSAVDQVISYRFLVTNTGNVTINNLAVDDNKASDESCPVTTLARTESTTCTASYRITANDLTTGSVTNTASATGKDPNGNTIRSNMDSETVTMVWAAIGNRVWLDENGNGVQDAGEDGIANVTVELRDSQNNTKTTATDADGGYLFPNVPPGTYTVTVTPPSGLNPTYDEDNGTVNPNGQTAVTVTAGQEHLTADFGYNWVLPTNTTNPTAGSNGAIGDRVWNDANGNGRQDPGEAGIANVTVRLLQDTNGDGVYGGTGDTGTLTTTTNASGNYIFDDRPQGAYVVEVDTGTLLPAGTWTQTGGNRTTQPILLAPGDVYVNADFGYQRSQGSTIGNLIYLDANGDGQHQPGELGIPGVTVALLDNTGKAIATTMTSDGTTDVNGDTVIDPAGTYLFPGLPSGAYTIVVTDTNHVLGEVVQTGDPNGGNDGKSDVTVDGSTNNLNQNFGYAPPGQTLGKGMIGDTIFLDRNDNRLFDAGEGLEGITVKLHDSTGATLLATTSTDENGHYGFGGLDPTGTYRVHVDTTTLPLGTTGLTNTVDPENNGDSISLRNLANVASGIDLNADFGYIASSPSIISGTVWEDRNGNGTLEVGELGIAGVTVALRDSNGNNRIATTITNANGDYSFTGLPDGTYTVNVTDDANLLEGYWHSKGTTGVDNNSQTAPYTVTVTAGQTNTTGDFGYFIDGAALGNRVWKDFNRNGIQDTGETGLSDVLLKIVITYPNGAGTTAAYTTSNTVDGGYRFGNLLLDENFNGGTSADQPTYIISVVRTPTGYAPSPIGATSDPKRDSNDPTGTTTTVERGQTDTAVRSDPNQEPLNASYDFGYLSDVPPPTCDRLTIEHIKQPYPLPTSPLRVVAAKCIIKADLGITDITCRDTRGNGGVILPPTPPSSFTPAPGGNPPPTQVLVEVWRDLAPDKMALPATFACTATDAFNQTGGWDPVTTFTLRYAGLPVNVTLTDQDGLVPEDRSLKVINGAPGLGNLEVIVNGVKFKLSAMQDSQEYTLDISSAMKPGGNIIILTPKGRQGSADISIGD